MQRVCIVWQADTSSCVAASLATQVLQGAIPDAEYETPATQLAVQMLPPVAVKPAAQPHVAEPAEGAMAFAFTLEQSEQLASDGEDE